MGLQSLVSSGKTEKKQNKVGKMDTEMTMTEPIGRKITREEGLPSPFDSMYMSPVLDIKGGSPATSIYGGIVPKKKKELEI